MTREIFSRTLKKWQLMTTSLFCDFNQSGVINILVRYAETKPTFNL